LSFIQKIKKITIGQVLALIFISVIWINFNQVRWNTKNVIEHDVNHYYSYLPAFFYKQDLSFSFLYDTLEVKQEQRYYAPNKAPNGNHVIKMTMGMAITYLPFFALADVWARLAGYEVSGFSEPYHFAVLFATLFYFLIGLYFLYKILSPHFNQHIISLVLICICYGTNVMFYLTLGAGMAHITDFALVAVLVYCFIQWHTGRSLLLTASIGCLAGLIILIRPVNILLFVFFIFYTVNSVGHLKEKIRFFYERKLEIVLLLTFSFIVILPQLLYWKIYTGQYLFNSYMDQGRFYFDRPHIIDGLFSFRKGWLIYSPLMGFSLIGIYVLRKRLKAFYLPILFLFLLYIYIVFSWWCWWYGGSFGQRVLIDIYPVLAIPLCAFFGAVERMRSILKNTVYSLTFLLILLNLFQTIQAKYNIIHYDSMTRKNYFEVFFTITKKADREKYLQHPDYKKALRGEDEY
jgi:hypothetical protein